MRELILGTVLVVGSGLGVFFWPQSEPVKTYPLSKKEATNMIDDAHRMLKKVKFDGWKPYAYIAGPGHVEFISRKHGSDAICIAEVEEQGSDGVSVEISCPGAKNEGPLGPHKTEVAKIALRELVDATLTGRQLDQRKVDAEFAKLDLSGLDETDRLTLEAQSKFRGELRNIGEENRQAARQQYADHYNSQSDDGDAGWGADATFNALED